MYIKEQVENTIVIEKSRFITYLKYVETIDEYKEFLKEIKKLHYSATHVCSACLLKDFQKSSDDGEPSGTAGVPILSTLEKSNMENICALVVRYFGGVKLGAGGLIRAYGGSVKQALDQATKYEAIIYPNYQLRLSYEKANKVDYYLRQNTIGLQINYQEDVEFIFALDDLSKIENIVELTQGIKPIYINDAVVEKVVE